MTDIYLHIVARMAHLRRGRVDGHRARRKLLEGGDAIEIAILRGIYI